MEAFHESVLDEILEERVVSSRGRRNPRGVKRKMSKWPIRRKNTGTTAREEIKYYIKVLK